MPVSKGLDQDRIPASWFGGERDHQRKAAQPPPPQLLVTLRAELFDGDRVRVSCTSMGGDSLATLYFADTVTLREVRRKLAATSGHKISAIALILPTGEVLEPNMDNGSLCDRLGVRTMHSLLQEMKQSLDDGSMWPTEAWFRSALQLGGRYHDDGRIKSSTGTWVIAAAPLPGVHQVTSNVLRVTLACDDNGFSERFILKFMQAESNPLHAKFAGWRSHAREVAAYEAGIVKACSKLQVPKSFCCAPGGQFMILNDLEEQAFSHFPSELTQWSKAAIHTLRAVGDGLHASWFAGGALMEEDERHITSPKRVWPALPQHEDQVPIEPMQLVRAVVRRPCVMEACGTAECKAISDVLAYSDEALGAAFRAATRPSVAPYELTLVHGDLHPDNIFWREKDELVAVMDWQTVKCGNPASDVAALLASALPHFQLDIDWKELVNEHAVSFARGVALRQQLPPSTSEPDIRAGSDFCEVLMPLRAFRLAALGLLLDRLIAAERLYSCDGSDGDLFRTQQRRVREAASLVHLCSAAQSVDAFAAATLLPEGFHIVEVEPPTTAAASAVKAPRDPLSAHFVGDPAIVRLHEGPETFAVDTILPRWCGHWRWRHVTVSLQLLEHRPTIRRSACMGVFDKLHNGHRCLLTLSAWRSKSIVIGIVADGADQIKAKRSAPLIEAFSERQNKVRRFMEVAMPQVDVTLVKIPGPPSGVSFKSPEYGRSIAELVGAGHECECFFTADEDVDAWRESFGTTLPVVGLPTVCDSDGVRLSATRLRLGENSSVDRVAVEHPGQNQGFRNKPEGSQGHSKAGGVGTSSWLSQTWDALLGMGRALGGYPSSSAAAVEADKGRITVDYRKPYGKISIKLHDVWFSQDRVSCKLQDFNADHTVADLRNFCAQCMCGQAVSIFTEVPDFRKGGSTSKPLTDDTQSLKDAGLLNSAVTVKRA